MSAPLSAGRTAIDSATPTEFTDSPRNRASLRGHLASDASLISLAIGAVVWELVARSWNVFFFPPLSAVVVRLIELLVRGTIPQQLSTSLMSLIAGMTISVVLGVALGLLMGAYRRIDLALDLYVRALLITPSLVLAPVFFSIFGLSQLSIVAIVVHGTMFIIILNTSSAVRSVPPEMLDMARSYCASDWLVFRRIVLPAATPLIMTGISLGAGRAFKTMISGEILIAVVGLGGMVATAGRLLDATTVLAVLVFVVMLSFIILWLVDRVERRLAGWLPSTNRA